jgi:PAS domain S-box-containing protein
LRKHMRDSGIPPLGRVSWGTHVCAFYDCVYDTLEILIPYFGSGLQNNEKCVWVCPVSMGPQKAMDALKAAIPGAESYLFSGQMTVLSYDEFYLDAQGGFAAQRVIGQWKTLLAQALSEGYEGLRVSGDTYWVDRDIWDSFCDYEKALYGSLDHERMVAVCCYPRQGAWVPDPIDVLSSHQWALVRKAGGWDAILCGKQREEHWETLFDGISEGVLVTDETGRILAANRAALNYMGAEALVDLGENIGGLGRRFSLKPGSGEDELTIPSLLVGQGALGKKRWLVTTQSDGSTLELLVHAREIEETSMSSQRFLVLLEDLTQVRSIEKARDRAIRILAHELRNPLQILKAVVPLVEDPPSAKHLARYVATLKKQVDSLSELTEDLLVAFRASSDMLSISPEPMNLTPLVVACVEGLRASGEHEIIPLYSPDVEVPVYADESRLHQILTNVLSNAAKYTPRGKRIWVDIRFLGGRVLVRAEDEGIGVPDGETDLIFHAFFRASNSSVASTEGLGLGLYISRQLARLHGGDLWAEDRPDGGTAMTLSLPLSVNGVNGIAYSREAAGSESS